LADHRPESLKRGELNPQRTKKQKTLGDHTEQEGGKKEGKRCRPSNYAEGRAEELHRMGAILMNVVTMWGG